MECENLGGDSKGHEKHPADSLETHITICTQNGIRSDIARKVTDSWTNGTNKNYQQMHEEWCSFCHQRGLPVLKVCVSNLVEYLNQLQVNHDYDYITLCMHVSAICSILQPTQQTRASTAPLLRQLLKKMFRKKSPVRVCADTSDVMKFLDLLQALEKPSALNYSHLTLKIFVTLALATVKRPSDLNLSKITPKAMQITDISITFNLCLGKNARPNEL